LGEGVFVAWTSSQTINVQYANMVAADTAWGSGNWRYDNSARINYTDSSSAGPNRHIREALFWTLGHAFQGINTPLVDSITYGNGKFVVVGRDGRKPLVGYSDDGMNWTFIPNASFPDGNFGSVVWGNDKFVAAGLGRIAYSRDGINWTMTANNIFPVNSIMNVAYGNGMYVAAGYIQGSVDTSGHRIAYSRDGINWTQGRSPLPDRTSINSIAYGNGKFIMVGDSQVTAGQLTRNARMIVSSDGINWSEPSAPPFTGTGRISGIIFANNVFYAYGSTGSGSALAYSADGERWVTNNNYITGLSTPMAYGGGRLIAAVHRAGRRSEDYEYNFAVLNGDKWEGVSWIRYYDDYDVFSSIIAVAYGNGMFVYGGGNTLYYSNDQEAEPEQIDPSGDPSTWK